MSRFKRKKLELHVNRRTGQLLKARQALQTEATLPMTHEELERLVRERTAELALANEELNQEINKRQQAEAALREREQLYLRLLDTTSESIWLIDAEGRMTYVNQQTADILGYTTAEMIGRSAFDFLFEEDLPQVQWYYPRMLQGIKEQYEWRWRCQMVKKRGYSLTLIQFSMRTVNFRAFSVCSQILLAVSRHKRL
jgi:PAS domain S-box-containing protein